MDIKVIKVGPLETNCYMLTIDNECLIIDPGDDFQKIKEAVGDKKVIGCLVTHFPQDHIEALEEVVSYYDIEINQSKYGKFVEVTEDTNIFIYPPYEFKAIDALITNFHLPKSTLLMLVSALASRQFIFEGYAEAIKEKYRFYSYGDCMFIL